jgi:hypothetical protein
MNWMSKLFIKIAVFVCAVEKRAALNLSTIKLLYESWQGGRPLRGAPASQNKVKCEVGCWRAKASNFLQHLFSRNIYNKLFFHTKLFTK